MPLLLFPVRVLPTPAWVQNSALHSFVAFVWGVFAGLCSACWHPFVLLLVLHSLLLCLPKGRRDNGAQLAYICKYIKGANAAVGGGAAAMEKCTYICMGLRTSYAGLAAQQSYCAQRVHVLCCSCRSLLSYA
jgi:hypothetical protein